MRLSKPLPNHPYHNKTNEELQYIMKDAREAALCFKGFNTAAENKYTDQLLDAIAIFSWRKRKNTAL
jgi:hypothetical protein